MKGRPWGSHQLQASERFAVQGGEQPNSPSFGRVPKLWLALLPLMWGTGPCALDSRGKFSVEAQHRNPDRGLAKILLPQSASDEPGPRLRSIKDPLLLTPKAFRLKPKP